jgi:hypothetical protein
MKQPSGRILSFQEQLNQEKLLEEITDLKEQLTNQKELRNFN